MKRRGRPDVYDWDALPLGEIPDAAVARRIGASTTMVWKARSERGIAPAPMETRQMASVQNTVQARQHMCACGAPAVERYRREWVCNACLNPDVPCRLEDHVRIGSFGAQDDMPRMGRELQGFSALLSERMAAKGIQRGATPEELSNLEWHQRQAKKRKVG